MLTEYTDNQIIQYDEDLDILLNRNLYQWKFWLSIYPFKILSVFLCDLMPYLYVVSIIQIFFYSFYAYIFF